MSAHPSEWTVVTVSHNSASVLRRCWEGCDLGGARWVVVDNASTDDSVEVARALGADVLARATNDGFSAANNAGLATVDTPWVMFANPNVVVSDGSGLARLAETLARWGAMVAPQLLNTDGTRQRNARGLPRLRAKLAHRGVPVPGTDPRDYTRGDLEVPTYVAWAIGAAIGGPTALFRDLGGWDERYFIYYEDHDLGLRSWRAGHPVILDPGVQWVHEWQRETARLRWGPWRHELRSARIFYREYPSLLRGRGPLSDPGLDELVNMLWRPANHRRLS